MDHDNPQSRNEEILIATIDDTPYTAEPQSRIEELLIELKETIESGGSGPTRTIIQITSEKAYEDPTLTTGAVAERIANGENIAFKYLGMLFTVSAYVVGGEVEEAQVHASTCIQEGMDTSIYFMHFLNTSGTTCTVSSKYIM